MLAREIAVFDRRHLWLRKPDSAHGACVWASERFCRHVGRARVVHLWGSRRQFPHRVDGYPALDPDHYHAVVVVDGVVIDWSRRQLEPRSPHPFIQPIADLRREWIRIGPTPEYLGL